MNWSATCSYLSKTGTRTDRTRRDTMWRQVGCKDEWAFALLERREKKRMSYPVGLVLCDRISLDSVFVKKTIKPGAR